MAAAELYQNDYVSMFDGRKDEDGHTIVVGVKDKFARIVLPDRIPGLKLADKSEDDSTRKLLQDGMNRTRQTP